MLPAPDTLIETFALFDDWEDRYAYVIDLGRKLPEMPEGLKVDEVLVPGCTSRVWLVAESVAGAGNTAPVFHFVADSDAVIVKGLVAVLLSHVQDKTAQQIRALDMKTQFERLGLSEHLTPNRRNGFFAMVERIKKLTA